MAAPDDAASTRRRTPLRRSWLDRIRAASAAAVGTARDVVDLGATDTSPRTAAYRVECDLDVDDVLFGQASDSTRLAGTSSLPPDERSGVSFPPDTQRETSFWDEAGPGASSRVLVLLGEEPPVVRSLGPDDPLADDVRDVRRWSDERASTAEVVADLGRRPAGPVAFGAAFDLEVSAGADPAEVLAELRSVPRAVDGALAGAVERVRVATSDWDEATAGDVAVVLLDGWETERDPATVVAYLTWFDAFHDTVLRVRPALRDPLRRLAERDGSATYEGPDGAAWSGEVRRRADALRAELG